MSVDLIEKMNPNSNPSQADDQPEILADPALLQSSEEPHSEDAEEKSAFNEQDKPKGHPLSVEDFIHRFETAPSSEEKLQEAIKYMRATLSQQGTPFFKGFWEARQRCIPLFKENLAAQSRADLWNEYRELCQESRRLKEILDEQSAFAAEQIEIAIKALENDIELFNDHLKKIALLVFPFPCATLEKKHEFYSSLQNELNLLNTHASRINALRKELIKTDMRIRIKNKFFRQLSAAGDHIFPKRKELIKNLSAAFLEDVDLFVTSQFSKDTTHSPLFFLREEIKALQAIAKLLTLNTYCFTQTRTKLSECWDRVKELEKDRKKERIELRSEFKQNAELVAEKIVQFRSAIESEEVNCDNLNAKVDELYNFMHSLKLGREEKQELREQINTARQPLLEKIKQNEEARLQKEHEIDRLKNERIKEVRTRVQHLLGQAENYTVDQIIHERDAILNEIQNTNLQKAEKLNLEKSLKSLKDTISDKKEKALMNLPEDDLESLEQLKVVLKQRKERRKEIKERLEEYRKISGSSSLDFEKAISYNEMIQAEKERLEKINHGLKEIEEKIEELESKAIPTAGTD